MTDRTVWAVATPHTAATDVAAEVLRVGGSAADAAVAAAALLAVVYPHQCAIGGDVIALCSRQGSAPVVVNGSGRAPRALDVDAVRRTSQGQMPWDGPLPITVPGAVSAWWQLHERFGRTPWSQLLAPAVDAARDGATVSRGLAEALHEERERVLADPGLAAVLAPDGRLLGLGASFAQPALSSSLQAIAEDGPGVLYGGAVGRRLVAGLARLGSSLSIEDLRRHRVDVTPSLARRWSQHQVHVAPPNSAGYVLLQLLGASRAGQDLDLLGRDAGTLARLFAVAAQGRRETLCDPAVAAEPISGALAEAHLAKLWRMAADHSSASRSPHRPVRRSGDTVAITVADGRGDFVSLLQSVYQSFGAAFLEPQTGVLLHDRGAAFSLDPAAANVLRPGVRPPHTLLPVLLERAGRIVAALASMGGEAQPQIHAQVLLQLRRGLTSSDAVAAPRWVVPEAAEGERLRVLVEEDVPADTMTSLADAGFEVQLRPRWHSDVGHVQVVRRAEGSGEGLDAGSDPRADGAAASG